MVECRSIKLPEFAVFSSGDGCGSRCVIEKSKLSEGFTWLVVSDLLWLGLSWEKKPAVELTVIDDVKDISFIALFDNFLIFLSFALFHGIKHDVQLFITECLEHKVA